MRVRKAEYLEGYKLRILFNNNKEKIVDLEKELYGPMYEPLKNVKYFKKVFVDSDFITVQWPNGEDFSPDVLYSMGEDVIEKDVKSRIASNTNKKVQYKQRKAHAMTKKRSKKVKE